MPVCHNKSCTRVPNDTDGPLLVCGACGTVKYCCKECQRADWKAGHKISCKGTKILAISQAFEICLLGVNRGGKASDQIARIRTVLEQSDMTLTAPDETSDQEHLENLLMSIYVPPIVQISERSFAVFCPGVFMGVYPSRDAALKMVAQEYVAFVENRASAVCGPHMFMHPIMARGEMPRLNWAEHCVIAVYMGMYDRVAAGDVEETIAEATRNLMLNKPTTLPRNDIPTGVFFPVLSPDKTKINVVPYVKK